MILKWIRSFVGRIRRRLCQAVLAIACIFLKFSNKKVSMIDVLQIPVSKDKLKALSKDERVALFLLGYVTNQIVMFEKILIFSTNSQSPEVLEQQASGMQTQMLLRLMIGILNEAQRVITSRYSENPICKEYRSLIDQDGLKALADLNQQFGTSNLLSRLRTNYAFHHPVSDDVEAAFKKACDDPGMNNQWNFYFSQHGFNSLFYLSDIVITHGIFETIGEQQWAVGQQKIMDEVTRAANNIKEFARAYTAAVWRKHFGTEMIADKVFKIAAPEAGEVTLPFYVSFPGEQPLGANLAFR